MKSMAIDCKNKRNKNRRSSMQIIASKQTEYETKLKKTE